MERAHVIEHVFESRRRVLGREGEECGGGRPEVGTGRIEEHRRHDADDSPGIAPNRQRAADGGGIATEFRLPECGAYDDRQRRARTILTRMEDPPEQRPRAEDVEERVRY